MEAFQSTPTTIPTGVFKLKFRFGPLSPGLATVRSLFNIGMKLTLVLLLPDCQADRSV